MRNDWALSTSVFFPDFSEKVLQDLAKNGIFHIELTGSLISDYDGYLENADEIFKTAQKYGVTIRSLHLPFLPFSEIDPASDDIKVRDAFIRVNTPFLKAASKSGIAIAVVHPSGEPYPEEIRDRKRAFSIDSLTRLQEVAKQENILLAAENLPRSCIGRDCYDIRAILDAIPDIYACFDTNHSLYDSNADMIRTMGNRMIATHISDYDFIDERHSMPGMGKICWEDLQKGLEEIGYQGTWNYELDNKYYDSMQDITENRQKILAGIIP